MNKYLMGLVIFSITILFSACGNESDSLNSEIQVEQKPVNKQAIIFPILPSKNIETSNLNNIEDNQEF